MKFRVPTALFTLLRLFETWKAGLVRISNAIGSQRDSALGGDALESLRAREPRECATRRSTRERDCDGVRSSDQSERSFKKPKGQRVSLFAEVLDGE